MLALSSSKPPSHIPPTDARLIAQGAASARFAPIPCPEFQPPARSLDWRRSLHQIEFPRPPSISPRPVPAIGPAPACAPAESRFLHPAIEPAHRLPERLKVHPAPPRAPPHSPPAIDCPPHCCAAAVVKV